MGKRPRIGLYSPYVPEHVGGGERYFFSVAESASEFADVTVLVREQSNHENLEKVREKYQQAFRLKLENVHFSSTHLGSSNSFLPSFLETLRFDVMYYLTDGSFFLSGAHRNIAHIQFPFTFQQVGLMSRVKLMNWSVKNANSRFTQRIVSKAWDTPIQFVHYPYVDTTLFKPAEKEKIILSVGRFFTGEKSGLHCKRQDLMVKMFKQMVDAGEVKGWRLVLIGTIDPGEDNAAYAAEVDQMAKGYPIKIFHDATFDVLRQYYSHASIYWHAAGFGIDQEAFPTKVEHFGISTIEAMASEAVPVVVNKGGLPEIIEHGKTGFLCESEQDFISYTRKLVERSQLLKQFQPVVRAQAETFSKERFDATLREMICG
jgi:glycosyltransferase involved in cell wall biosynthesis